METRTNRRKKFEVKNYEQAKDFYKQFCCGNTSIGDILDFGNDGVGVITDMDTTNDYKFWKKEEIPAELENIVYVEVAKLKTTGHKKIQMKDSAAYKRFPLTSPEIRRSHYFFSERGDYGRYDSSNLSNSHYEDEEFIKEPVSFEEQLLREAELLKWA